MCVYIYIYIYISESELRGLGRSSLGSAAHGAPSFALGADVASQGFGFFSARGASPRRVRSRRVQLSSDGCASLKGSTDLYIYIYIIIYIHIKMPPPPPPRRAYLSTSKCTKSSYFKDRVCVCVCAHIRKKCAVVANCVWVTSLWSNSSEEFINFQESL